MNRRGSLKRVGKLLRLAMSKVLESLDPGEGSPKARHESEIPDQTSPDPSTGDQEGDKDMLQVPPKPLAGGGRLDEWTERGHAGRRTARRAIAPWPKAPESLIRSAGSVVVFPDVAGPGMSDGGLSSNPHHGRAVVLPLRRRWPTRPVGL